MSNPNRTPAQMVQEHIAGLAPVVHWLDQHPDLKINPEVTGHGKVHAFVSPYDGDGTERFAAAVRALKDGAPLGTIRREDTDSYTSVIRDFGAVTFELYTTRDTVCEKVVVGTETVEIADPDAPKVTVEREIVEWKCSPILAGADARVDELVGF